MGSLWWEQGPIIVLCKDVGQLDPALGRARAREEPGAEVQGWRNCGMKGLWCSSSHHQAPTAGWASLSPVTWQYQPSLPLLWQPRKGEQGVERGIQTAKLLLISNVLTPAPGLMEEGSGWMLLIWSRVNMKNNMARPSTHWAAQARGLFCFSVLLSFSPPLGFVALELQGWKIIHPNHSSHNTLCEHLWLQTPLQQWVGAHKFIILTSLASCQAGHEAQRALSQTQCGCHSQAILTGQNLLGSLCDKSLSCACPGDEELPPWLLGKLSFSCRCLQVHPGCREHHAAVLDRCEE